MKIILLLLMAVLPVNSQDSRIVFGGVATGRADTKYYGDIYIVDPDGDTTPVPLTKGLITHEPVWSPDGREIAFFRINYTPGEFVVEVHDIGIMNADGSNIREMDRGKRSCRSRRENDDDLSCIRRIEHIRWSPDGSLIVLAAFDIDRFTASVEYALSIFFLYPGKWSWEQRVDILPDVSHRDWIPFGHLDVLPDGRIAYSICCSTNDPGMGLWIANPDGTDPRKIDGFPVGNNFDVSPDGSMIAFTGDDGYWEREDEKDWITEIEIMDIDGSNRRHLTYGSSVFSWSPDSRRIVFADKYLNWGGFNEIKVVDIDGSNERTLFDSEKHGIESISHIDWSPWLRDITSVSPISWGNLKRKGE